MEGFDYQKLSQKLVIQSLNKNITYTLCVNLLLW